MSRQKTLAENRRAKYADYMRAIGTPLHITDVERKELIAHLAGLYERGMSYALIADSAPGGHHETCVAKILRGWTGDTHRDIYNDLMKASYKRPTVLRSGARIDPTGVRRRLQGLVAAGFGYNVIGREMGVSAQAVFQLCTSDRPAASSTSARVADLYKALECADPYDHGATQMGVSRAKGVAKRNGWPPRTCWDPDTIDDPNAAPEWTGACGTREGFLIHDREGIPLCDACRPHRRPSATSTPRTSQLPGFSPDKMRALRDRRGVSAQKLAGNLGMDPSTISYWESGRSVPRRRTLDRVLSALGATFEDVSEEEE